MARRIEDRRGAARTVIALQCTLRRPHGSPVDARTVDLGPGGMSVTTVRPLTQDEMLVFALPAADGVELTGHARVLRERAHHVYALRFERLLDPVRDALDELASGADRST